MKGGLRLRSRLQADLELRDVKPISDFVLAEGLIENVDLWRLYGPLTEGFVKSFGITSDWFWQAE